MAKNTRETASSWQSAGACNQSTARKSAKKQDPTQAATATRTIMDNASNPSISPKAAKKRNYTFHTQRANNFAKDYIKPYICQKRGDPIPGRHHIPSFYK